MPEKKGKVYSVRHVARRSTRVPSLTRGGPGLPDVIRCARRKHARSIISSFLRDSGMHQARLFIPIVFLLYSLSFSVSAATLPSGFIETTVASGIASPTAMAIAPDGRIFVCSQSGALRVIKNGVRSEEHTSELQSL